MRLRERPRESEKLHQCYQIYEKFRGHHRIPVGHGFTSANRCGNAESAYPSCQAHCINSHKDVEDRDVGHEKKWSGILRVVNKSRCRMSSEYEDSVP